LETPESSIEVVVDLGVYSQTAVLKATYKFTGNCYVSLEKGSESAVTVLFTSKSSAILPSNLKEEFLNELLDQRLRECISAETLPVRNLIMAHALSKLDFIRTPANGATSSHGGNNLQAGQ
jgi:His-Xaa-Ser system protein HxsD